MPEPKLEFIRVERTCKWNEELRAKEKEDGLPVRNIIYDFKVVIDGEYRARLERTDGKYTLCEVDGAEIARRDGGQHPILVRGQDNFVGFIQKWLHRIPTSAAYEAHKAEMATLLAAGEARRRKEAQVDRALDLLARYMDICGHQGQPLFTADLAQLPDLWEEANQVRIAAGH